MYVGVFHLQKQRNRPGQRTRQKQWETVFGSKAKHLQTGSRHQKNKGGTIVTCIHTTVYKATEIGLSLSC